MSFDGNIFKVPVNQMVSYWYHPESDSFYTQTGTPKEGDGLSYEITKAQYDARQSNEEDSNRGAYTQELTDLWTKQQFAEQRIHADRNSVDSLLITSHSIDGTFESCPRRFEFLHTYLRAPDKESDAYAADVGTALHEATQTWQRALFTGTRPNQAEALGNFTLLKHWPWESEAERMAINPETSRRRGVGARTLGNSLLLLQQIYESTIWSEWELVSIEGFGPAIEVPWRIIHKSLGPVPMPYGKTAWLATQGKIDFILRHRRSKKFKVVDLKTTEKEKPAHDASFRFSGQAGQYGMVLDHALGLDWQHEGMDATYLIAPFDEDLGVYPLNYHLGPEEIRDLIEVKVERLERMKEYALKEYWPRRSHGCDYYGHPCGFLDICTRRDKRFVEQWFEFEMVSGRFKEYKRVYDPVWILEA